MKQDLLGKWLNITGLENHPLERPSKKRRIDCPRGEELKSTAEPPSPSILPRAHSDDYRPASRYAILSYWKQIQDEEVCSYIYSATHEHWPSRYTNRTQYQAQRDLNSYFQHSIDPINPILRRSESDSCLIGSKGSRMPDTAKAENMPGELKPSRPNLIASTGKNMTSSPSDRTVATGSKNSKESKRIDATSTNYRSDVLALNRVLFKSTLAPLPANVAAVVGKIVLTSSSSEMDDATATKLRDTIIQLGEDAEAELGHGFVAMDVLPPKAEERKLKRTQQMPFTNTTLPRAIIPEGLSVTIQTICEPKPGVAYGYTLQGFTPSQQIAQRSTINGVDLAKHSRPAKDLYWPFFVVEFKAPAVGGNIYAAASQCAGGGSAAVMAVQTLCTAASQPNDSTHLTDSIEYSAAIDGAAADLHIH